MQQSLAKTHLSLPTLYGRALVGIPRYIQLRILRMLRRTLGTSGVYGVCFVRQVGTACATEVLA